MANRSKSVRRLATALMFLGPNILGVLVFVVFPVIFAVILAFTNWDLRYHNQFQNQSLRFVGFGNFLRLLTESDFLRFLGNTLYLMMGIPLSVGASLVAAIFLSKDTRGGGGRVYLWLIATAGLLISTAVLAMIGLGATAMIVLLVGLACGILVLGMTGGVTAYRTLFYTPHFTAGVGTYLLWKKLYNPQTGPINQTLTPVLDDLAVAVNAAPAVVSALRWLPLALMVGVFAWAVSRLRALWTDGEMGSPAAILPVVLLITPTIVAWQWSYTATEAPLVAAMVALTILWQAMKVVTGGRQFTPPHRWEGAGSVLAIGLTAMVLQFVLLGLAAVARNLPAMAADGLEPPMWISDYAWAKPSLMIMAFWGAIGSNNMLLYLAALTNVPQELYEACDVDGATRFQRFWHVTWPQLAPTTFFILVMSTISGLQGGFEMARTMTKGGPAGSTTTLSYFIYQTGFDTGRLAFAAATSWILFLLVFSVTIFNWKFGNKYVNN